MTNKNLYCFILGRNPALSVAEIVTVLEKDISKVTWISERVMAVELNKGIVNTESLMESLYGTTKIVRVLDIIKTSILKREIERTFTAANLQRYYFPENSKKFIFGISFYNLNVRVSTFRNLLKQARSLNYLIKEKIEKAGTKCGFLKIDKKEVSSGSIKRNQLLEKGVDIVIVTGQAETFLGKTIAIQKFAEYEWRNYHRPVRDLKSGMMPIKLARTMITLAQTEKEETVLDPFCGSGTILQELILLGFKKIIGLDNSEKAVANAKKNIDWLFEQYPVLDKSRISLKILTQDARKMDEIIPPNSIGTIISEPYLGPLREKQPRQEEITNTIKELSSLYLDFFFQAFNVLKLEGRVVIIFPCFRLNKKFVFLKILDEIKKIGFLLENPLPEELYRFPVIKCNLRKSLLFIKEKQIVIREVLIFRKSS